MHKFAEKESLLRKLCVISMIDLNKVQTKDDLFVAHHAGYTKEEMEIDVSVFNS